MSQKYFTLPEAQALLPVIQEELHHLQKLQSEFQEKYVDLRSLSHDDPFELECQLEFLQMEADLHIKNIHKHGVQLKDIDHGLIDFPARINGQEVLLCWKQGENEIEYYHGIHDGFSGRKKLNPEDTD